jgi:ABC-type amino acid transport substrate-binding protein
MNAIAMSALCQKRTLMPFPRWRRLVYFFAAQGGYMNRRNSTDTRVVDFVKSGKIRAGLAEAPIMATKDPATGELRGVAVELSRELAARIGVELVQLAAFDLLQAAKAEVCALPLPNLLQYSARLPGSRILDESFGVNRVGIVVPKGQPEHLAYFSDFIEDAKASGFVQRAIERAGLGGVRVAPPAESRSQ